MEPTKSFWANSLAELHSTQTNQIVGELARRVSLIHSGDEAKQVDAWHEQIEILKQSTQFYEDAGKIGILLELPLNRVGKRIDTILTTPQGVICIEFKIGGSSHTSADIRQTEDYAICLRSFHQVSHDLPIYPILCVTKSKTTSSGFDIVDGINQVWRANSFILKSSLEQLYQLPTIDTYPDWEQYDRSSYSPTPSIIEAARQIYAGHSISDIGRTDSSRDDLDNAAATLKEVIKTTKVNRQHTVCFISGEPGAGKTLLGLNLVFGNSDDSQRAPAALLSGNRPLVAVLREALANDAVSRTGIKKQQATREASQALQHLLGYLKEHLNDAVAPPEHVIVFDEAQRAWDAETGDKLLKRHASEPEMFLEIMSKLPWACLVCLVGPGQEINKGEMGMSLWKEAIASTHNKGVSWSAVSSPEAATALRDKRYSLTTNPKLYLPSQLRAYKNAKHGEWVKQLLDGNIQNANNISKQMAHPPALVCRSLKKVKQHLAQRSRGKHRVGLIASSGAKRLIADGIPPSPLSKELKEVAHWFLKPEDDFRSSNALEVPLSEFVCQGLEIDFAGLCWGHDLVWENNNWQPRQMIAPKWSIVRNATNARFKINAYRVLLTRSRLGLVIYVPQGSDRDSTRSSKEMDRVYATLISAGCRPL